MDTAGSAPGNRFYITRQESLTRYDPDRGEVQYWKVHFQTASGIDSSVQVDDEQYTAEYLADLINSKVTEIERVNALGQ